MYSGREVKRSPFAQFALVMIDAMSQEFSIRPLIYYEGGDVCALLGKNIEKDDDLSWYWQTGEVECILVVHFEKKWESGVVMAL